MKFELEKKPKVALCRACHGTGKANGSGSSSGDGACKQCDGSGRVTVSARMTLDIRPYRPNVELRMKD